MPKPQPAPRTSGPAQVPLETQPRVRVPTSTGLSAAPKPQGARSGPGAPAETDRRLPKPADTADEGPDTGPQPVPVAASSVSHAKLEWAQTQARVPTPPLGVPALDDSAPGLGDDEERDEPTAIRPLSAAARPQLTSGTSPELAGVSEASLSVVTDVKPSSSSSRKVIAALLLVVTAVFGAMVWKLKGSGSAGASTIARVTPVLLLDEDGGEPRAAPAPAVPADSGDHAYLDPDGGDDFEDDDDDDDGGEAALEEEDAGPHDVDAGVGDGGSQPRPVKKKKPTKRRRRR
ncbi:MAG: hypothetical protein IAE78_30210 [Myxococcus sp.]|nr:hypothetical protein [Myxococcus sp.]